MIKYVHRSIIKEFMSGQYDLLLHMTSKPPNQLDKAINRNFPYSKKVKKGWVKTSYGYLLKDEFETAIDYLEAFDEIITRHKENKVTRVITTPCNFDLETFKTSIVPVLREKINSSQLELIICLH